MKIHKVIDRTVEIDDLKVRDALISKGLDESSIMIALNNLQDGLCIVTKVRVRKGTDAIAPTAVYQILDTNLIIQYFVEDKLI